MTFTPHNQHVLVVAMAGSDCMQCPTTFARLRVLSLLSLSLSNALFSTSLTCFHFVFHADVVLCLHVPVSDDELTLGMYVKEKRRVEQLRDMLVEKLRTG